MGRVKEDRLEPFAILVATVLCLRTRDTVTEKAFGTLWRLASTPREFLDLPPGNRGRHPPRGVLQDQAALPQGHCRAALERHGGEVPADLDALLALPGVGRQTATSFSPRAWNSGDLRGHARSPHLELVGLRGHGRARRNGAGPCAGPLPKPWWMPINGLLVSFGQTLCKPVGPKYPECPLRREVPYPEKRW